MIDNIMGSACVQEIREQIEFFEISDFVEFKRIALTRQQVKAYDSTQLDTTFDQWVSCSVRKPG